MCRTDHVHQPPDGRFSEMPGSDGIADERLIDHVKYLDAGKLVFRELREERNQHMTGMNEGELECHRPA